MPDAAYALTRREGRTATIVQVPSVAADPETGAREQVSVVTNVRNVVKEPTAYSRILRAQATQQDVGTTTFIFWTRDIPAITRLEVEDYIIMGGVKHMVVTSAIERTSLVVTAKEIVGDEPTQEISLDLSQSMLSENATPTVTP